MCYKQENNQHKNWNVAEDWNDIIADYDAYVRLGFWLYGRGEGELISNFRTLRTGGGWTLRMLGQNVFFVSENWKISQEKRGKGAKIPILPSIHEISVPQNLFQQFFWVLRKVLWPNNNFFLLISPLVKDENVQKIPFSTFWMNKRVFWTI